MSSHFFFYTIYYRVYTKFLEVLQEGNFLEPSARAERGILEAFARVEWLLHSEYSKLGEC